MNKKSRSRTKRTTTRSVLRLLDLEHAKAAVLNSLTSRDAQRTGDPSLIPVREGLPTNQTRPIQW